MSQKWIKLDVSRTEICLDPSIYFRMKGIHVNMSCLVILKYLFHLYCSMFYNWITILLYKACKGKTTLLESEGLQTRSLQKIQMPGDNKPTPVFKDTAPAQRNPTPTNTKQIPVAKELARSSPPKEYQLHSKKHVHILASWNFIAFWSYFLHVSYPSLF